MDRLCNFFLNIIETTKFRTDRQNLLFRSAAAEFNLEHGMNEQTPNQETQHEGPADAASLNETNNHETLSAENERLRSEIGTERQRFAQAVFRRDLENAGALTPELLSEFAAKRIELSETGEFENAEKLVDELRRTMPEQFAGIRPEVAGIDAAAGTEGSSAVLTREMLARMPAERIAELDWETVKRVLAD